MEMMLWNIVLSAIVGVMVFMLKGKFDELQRISILLNKTREEVARDTLPGLRCDRTWIKSGNILITASNVSKTKLMP
jgi:hypothetical protein